MVALGGSSIRIGIIEYQEEIDSTMRDRLIKRISGSYDSR